MINLSGLVQINSYTGILENNDCIFPYHYQGKLNISYGITERNPDKLFPIKVIFKDNGTEEISEIDWNKNFVVVRQKIPMVYLV